MSLPSSLGIRLALTVLLTGASLSSAHAELDRTYTSPTMYFNRTEFATEDGQRGFIRTPKLPSFTFSIIDDSQSNLDKPEVFFNGIKQDYTFDTYRVNADGFTFTMTGTLGSASAFNVDGKPTVFSLSTVFDTMAMFYAYDSRFVYRGNIFNSSSSDRFGTFTITPVVSAVPEPETYAMMLGGLGLIGFTARRRKAKQPKHS